MCSCTIPILRSVTEVSLSSFQLPEMGAVLLAAWWMLGSLADLSFIYFYNAAISQTAPTSKAERE